MTSILDDLTLQQRAAATQTVPTLVIAGAGTGKRKTLTAAVADRITRHEIRGAGARAYSLYHSGRHRLLQSAGDP